MTRPLVSGRDYQLRYALWRAVQDARTGYSRSLGRVRVEWPVTVRSRQIFVDVLFEDDEGKPVEIVECKEHEGFIDPNSLKTFLANASKLRTASRDARWIDYRFVTNARFVRIHGTTYDFVDFEERKRALAAARLKVPRRNIIWEAGAPGKSQLTGDCIFYLSKGRGDAHDVYARLYASLAAQMALRHNDAREPLLGHLRDLQVELFGEAAHTELPEGRQSLQVRDVGRLLASHRRSGDTIARDDALHALRRNLFDDTNVSLSQVFVEPDTLFSIAEPRKNRTILSNGAGTGMLFRWLGGVRDGTIPRKPLVLLGPFGSGKSCLLTKFAAQAAGSNQITPILVPLRDIITAGKDRSLRDELVRYVREMGGIDLAAAHPDDSLNWCLICDGFDELNLFYSDREDAKWIDQCFRDLASLAARKDIAMVISSRPILFMDLRRTGHPADGCPQLEIRPFDDDHIRLWCANYRHAAGLSADFSPEFLEERNLVEVARTPIVLFMIARIYETSPELLTKRDYTRAGIYETFITWTVSGGYRADDRKHEVPDNYREILEEIARHMFQTGTGIADRNELLAHLRSCFGETIDDIPVDQNLLVAHMFKPIDSNAAARKFVEFSHQSFREFLVAERAWRLLEPARRGAGLDASTWSDLAGRLFTPAKISFLADMLRLCSDQEAAALFHALARAENIHSYWNEWAKPLWSHLETGTASLAQTREKFETLAVRATAQAVLAFILRIKALRQIRDQKDVESILLQVDPIATLRRLLQFQSTFGDTGLVAASRELLLQNLEGLQSSKKDADASGLALDLANLTRVDIHECDFSRASLIGTDMIESAFRRCSFARSMFQPRRMNDVTLEDCNFAGATLSLDVRIFEGAAPYVPNERITFRRCNFERTFFTYAFLTDSVFEDCHWAHSVFRPKGRDFEISISDSRLDDASRRYLESAGVKVVRPR